MRDLYETIEILDIIENPPYRLSKENYSFSLEYFGTVINEGDDEGCPIGSLNIIVNGRTGEVNRFPIFSCFENTNKITSEEWDSYLTKYDYSAKSAKLKYVKAAIMLYELNSRENFIVKDSEYDENDYVNELIMYNDQFEIRYYFAKLNKSHHLSLHVNECYVSLSKQSFKYYDKVMDFVKQHANLNLLFI